MTNEQKKAETRAKLKAFLKGEGHPDDVQSVLVHTLMEHAEANAEKQAAQQSAKQPAPAKKPKKKK